MKQTKKQPSPQPVAARKVTKPRTVVPKSKTPAVRTAAATRPQPKPSKAKPFPPPKPTAVAAQKPSPEPARPAFAEDILRELRGIRSAVTPKQARAEEADAGLESAVDSLRRLLSELLERDHEAILRELVQVHLALTDSPSAAPRSALERVDRLMDRLGAIRFSARELDFVDPLIHEIRAERQKSSLPDGLVAEGLRPGFRTANGVVLAKTWVAVNRRPEHEPARH